MTQNPPLFVHFSFPIPLSPQNPQTRFCEMKLLPISTLVLLGVVVLTRVEGITRHVRSGGEDTTDCTALPCSTLSHALSVSQNMDVISMGPGTFDESDGGEHIWSRGRITIAGSGEDKTILDMAGHSPGVTGHGFVVGAASEVIMSDLTILNPSSVTDGGSVYIGNQGASWTGNKVSMINCYSGGHGGCISSVHGSGTISCSACTFKDSKARGNGGIIHAPGGRLEIQGSKFVGGIGVNGGAIFVGSTAVAYLRGNCEISNSTSEGSGGAIFVADGGSLSTASSSSVLIHANVAEVDGGGLFVSGMDADVSGLAPTTRIYGNFADNIWCDAHLDSSNCMACAECTAGFCVLPTMEETNGGSNSCHCQDPATSWSDSCECIERHSLHHTSMGDVCSPDPWYTVPEFVAVAAGASIVALFVLKGSGNTISWMRRNWGIKPRSGPRRRKVRGPVPSDPPPPLRPPPSSESDSPVQMMMMTPLLSPTPSVSESEPDTGPGDEGDLYEM